MHYHSVAHAYIAVPGTPALPATAPALTARPIGVFAALACVLALGLLAAYPPVAAAQSGPPPQAAPDTTAPDTTASDPAGLGPFAVYQSDGTVASLTQIEAALDTVDVLLIGETHDDPTAHALQDSLFRRAQAAAASGSRPLALSLEMFERDVQPVVDEYLAGIISERHFIDDARAWSNYRSAYAPLVNRARGGGHPVLAANAPRRYVNLVARSGPSVLSSLSEQALGWLAPRPYPGPTPAYQQKWRDLMREAMPPGHGHTDTTSASNTSAPKESPTQNASTQNASTQNASTQNASTHNASTYNAQTPNASTPNAPSPMLQAQALWDATMAHTMARHLLQRPGAMIVHVTGAFHVTGGTGTPEALRHYRPSVRALIVVIRPAADPERFVPDEHEGLGDFVILTDASRVPSRNR